MTALCNEGGGYLVVGMEDAYPHKVCGTRQNEGSICVLEANIYRDIGIRVKVYELFEDESARTGRILEIEVPARPVGRVFKFEDVPLMRIGEELRPMPDAQLLSILQEQEPDFSEQICNGIDIEYLTLHFAKYVSHFYKILRRKEMLGYFNVTDRYVNLNLNGIFISDHIISEFFV